MPPVGFEPTISAGERPQTYALDRAATWTGIFSGYLGFFFRGALQAGREGDYSPPATAKVKNEWSYASSPLLCLYGVFRHMFTCLFFYLFSPGSRTDATSYNYF